jgi:ABC-2 type transport system ATP-binding protein
MALFGSARMGGSAASAWGVRRGASSGPGEPIIEARDLHMRYGEVEAVCGLDLVVGRGEVVAVLGPNGAGKTTTVEILEGYRRRSSGEVRVLGEDPQRASAAWRGRVGVVLQESRPERGLSVLECVTLYAGYHRRSRPVGELLELVGLSADADVRATRLSGGKQRRLDVALALVGDPELVFLDEPTTGFDPAARRAAWEMIAGLRKTGVTVLLTTHYLEEAEALADRIAVIAGGRIVADGPPGRLAGRDRRPTRVLLRVEDAGGGALPAPLAGAVRHHDGRLMFESVEPLRDLAAIEAWARGGGHRIADLEVRPPSLEEVYLELTRGKGEP